MDFDYQRMCSTSSGIGCYGERSIPTMENRLLGYPLSLDFLSATSSNPLKHCRSDNHDIDRESRDGLLKLTKGESFTEPRSLHSDHYSHPLISTSNNTASLPNNMQEVLPNSNYNGDPRFLTDPVSSIRNNEPYQHMLPISTLGQMHFSSLPYSIAPSAGGLPLSMYYRDPLFSQLPGCQEIGDVGMTVSQRAELFHHTLIYRYMRSGRSIPLELLNPIRNSVALLNGYASYAMFPAGAAWGGYHLGLSNSCTDLEPGRCRRTDGKKWRCSKEVVPDQKYCDRHMHRGRHRGKKLHTAATSDINGTSVLTEPTQSISSCPTTTATATTAAQDHNPETGKNGSCSVKKFNRFLMCSDEDDHEDRHAASSRSGTSYQLTTSSPDSPPLSLSPLKRSTSREDSIQMGLAVAGMGLASRSNMALEDEHPLIHSEQEQDEEHVGATINFWIPVAWDNSRQADVAGGPLGEVLHHSTTPLGPSNKTNFDIRTDAWENNPRIPDGHRILA